MNICFRIEFVFVFIIDEWDIFFLVIDKGKVLNIVCKIKDFLIFWMREVYINWMILYFLIKNFRGSYFFFN